MENQIHTQVTVTIPTNNNEIAYFQVQFLKMDASTVIDKIAAIETVSDLQKLEWEGFVTVQ